MQVQSEQVTTKEQLQQAVKARIVDIEVQGELAEKLSKAIRLRTASKWTLRALPVGIATMPFTGGVSGFAAITVATLTGLEIAVILAIVFLGLALVLLILKEYDVVNLRAKRGDEEATVHLRRKQD
ncbi:MAG: hypothetical protein OXE83_05665 [Gammaproteobacteria bacterium]|nr:hypothetical protein [Gammaproteobacteria bacterium]